MNNLQRSWHDANFDVCEKVNKELYGIWQPANIELCIVECLVME